MSTHIWLGLAVLIALSFTWWKRQVRRRAVLLAHVAHLEEKLEATASSGIRLASHIGSLERLLVQKGLLDESELEGRRERQRPQPPGSSELH